MKKANEHVLSILADNKIGVLTIIITGVRREGCNIKSLTAARTSDNDYSRITISIECYDYLIDDVISRIKTLNCVKSLVRFQDETFVEREYAVFSIVDGCEASDEIIRKYGAKEISDCIYELSGERKTISGCISEIKSVAKLEVARTGSIILEKGIGR